MIEIRAARPDDFICLQEIEVRAGSLFVDVGLPEIAADPPPTTEELAAAAVLLVAVDAEDRPVGYARGELLDGHAHLEQLSVLPELGRGGIGTNLLQAMVAWARGLGEKELTLTTFRDVPFNEPLYRRRGFEVVPENDRAPWLVALMAEEAAHGLDPSRRVAMRREIS